MNKIIIKVSKVLHYTKEARELLLKIEKEIQTTNSIFIKTELEHLSGIFPVFQRSVGPSIIDDTNQKEFKASFYQIKEICDSVNQRVRQAFMAIREKIETPSGEVSSTLLIDYRELLTQSLFVRQMSNIMIMVNNCDLVVTRINNIPDIHCVDNWTKMWAQLWKLNVVRNPTSANFAGADGDLLKQMFSLFKSDYAILVDKLTPLNMVHPEAGVQVEVDHLKPDAELLKQALIPKDPKKISQTNEYIYQQVCVRL